MGKFKGFLTLPWLSTIPKLVVQDFKESKINFILVIATLKLACTYDFICETTVEMSNIE